MDIKPVRGNRMFAHAREGVALYIDRLNP